MKISTVLFIFFIFVTKILSFETREYGTIKKGLPNREERLTHHYMNAARINGSFYAKIYGSPQMIASNILNPNNYPSARPIWLEDKLSKAGRSQCIDLADNCPPKLMHESCDGTNMTARVNKFFSCGFNGELGLRGFRAGSITVNGILCENKCGGAGTCCEDGNQDVHRSKMMDDTHQVGGVGFFFNYHFIDFSTCDDKMDSAIYSGLHEFTDDFKTHMNFMCLFYLESGIEGGTEVIAKVHMNEYSEFFNYTTYIMELEYMGHGGDSRHYVYRNLPTQKVEGCRDYWFEVIIGKKEYRFPDHGIYYTTGENSDCTKEYKRVIFPVDVVGITFGVIGIVVGSIIGIVICVILCILAFIFLLPILKVWINNRKKKTGEYDLDEFDEDGVRRPRIPSKKPGGDDDFKYYNTDDEINVNYRDGNDRPPTIPRKSVRPHVRELSNIEKISNFLRRRFTSRTRKRAMKKAPPPPK